MTQIRVRLVYRFGPFQLDIRERRLSRGSDVIPLRPKVFETLRVLVENAGRLVTKQELLDALWPTTAVEENNLNHNVSILRRALEERATGQQLIETVPRVGYRFAAAVEVAEPRPEASVASAASGQESPFRTASDDVRLAQAGIGRGAAEQRIRFTTTADGVCLAYSVVGSGPPIVRVLGHFTHLVKEWDWPELRRFWECLAEQYSVVRYDGRGIGLSDRFTGEFTEETRQLDLDAVLDAVGARQAALIGISEGGWTAATYAIRHPDRVSQLILYGAYCRGAQARPGYDHEEDRALLTLIRKGWGRDTPAFRQVITSQFFRSDADPSLLAHFNELQRLSADGDTAARYHEACHRRGDGRDLFRQVKTPTLVLHFRDDVSVRAEEGRLLASIIPGAQLVLLPSGGHYFPTDADVAQKAAGAIARFLQTRREG
jgi:DNA-binding winged helix-turn-helix (wHTH) protein/pimeloyl-ACP methyl ester carboxylesterase